MTQRIIEITSPIFVPEAALAADFAPLRLFAAERPLALEIGCGVGDFIVELAQRRPERNYLAIDIYNQGCLKTCRRIEAAGLTNVRVLRLEARYLLERFLPPASLAAVYINCPDPWPKKRHRRRRLVNDEFLANLRFYLQPAGEFCFSSDVLDYAAEVAAQIGAMPGWDNLLPAPYTVEPPVGYPLSKYMRRFLAQEQPIHYVHCRRAAAWNEDTSSLEPLRPGFRTRWKVVANG